MDFIERLTERVNEIPGIPINCQIGFLDTTESFVVYPLPGGRTVTEFMDGTKEQVLPFEFAMKSRSQSKIHATLWLVQNVLDDLKELESQDNSFEFDKLSIASKPFINNADDQGFFTFLLDVQANITILKGDD